MRPLLPHAVAYRQNRKWRYRPGEIIDPLRTHDSLRKTTELLNSSAAVLQREDLSVGAKTLYRVLCHQNEYVICIDPRTLASVAGVSEQKIRNCLNELASAGAISMWMGNLVFFE